MAPAFISPPAVFDLAYADFAISAGLCASHWLQGSGAISAGLAHTGQM